MVLWDPIEAEGVLASWRVVFLVAADDLSFKNGAFKGRITVKTQALEAVNMFLDSNLCTPKEEEVLRKFRRWIFSLMRGGPRLGSDELLGESLLRMVAKDAVSNGAKLTPQIFLNGIAKKDAVTNAALAERKGAASSSMGEGSIGKEHTQGREKIKKEHTDKIQTKEPGNLSKGNTDSDFGGAFKKSLCGAFF